MDGWIDWVSMATGTLSGVSQMVWQNAAVVTENRILFADVTGTPPAGDRLWRGRITWAGATLLALSTEQSLKGLAVRASGKCRRTHDLQRLWKDLCPDDRKRIARAATQLQERTRGTRLAAGSITGIEHIERVIRRHRRTLEHARYYAAQWQRRDLEANVELWNLALSALIYARELFDLEAKLTRPEGTPGS